MEKALRIYAWFLLVVTALPAAARLARPRELARILLFRQDEKRRRRARIGGIVYLVLSVLAIPVLFFRTQLREERWLSMALLVGAVSALEFLMNSRLYDEERLARQNRMFGGVYAAMAIATALLLLTR